jgi:hypothetical protein
MTSEQAFALDPRNKINFWGTPKIKVIALRDLTIDTGIPDLTAEEQADYNKKVRDWQDREMASSVQMAIRKPEEKPKLPHSKTKKKFYKKGETFEASVNGEKLVSYLQTNLIKGIDVAVEGESNVNKDIVEKKVKYIALKDINILDSSKMPLGAPVPKGGYPILKTIKKGEIFEGNYPSDGGANSINVLGEILQIGKDIQYATSLNSNNQSNTSSTIFTKENTPWILLGVVVVYLVFKN